MAGKDRSWDGDTSIRSQLKAVPRGIDAAAGIIDGTRGGAKIPPPGVTALERHLARYD